MMSQIKMPQNKNKRQVLVQIFVIITKKWTVSGDKPSSLKVLFNLFGFCKSLIWRGLVADEVDQVINSYNTLAASPL